MSKSVTFFRVPIINISANIEITILNIQEEISIQKTIRDKNSGFRIIPDSIIIINKNLLK